jgi:N-acetylmuramoyl-L-alanine amidase CwlA
VKIEPHTYKWAAKLVPRAGGPKGIVLHHAAASDVTADQIHKWHLGNGWSGIGYHAFITKEGRIIRGRPVGMRGAHCLNAGDWLGICHEGNFDHEQMNAKQLAASKWLVKRWRSKFGISKSKVKRHRDMAGNATACPGRNFPQAKIVG